MKNKRGKTDPQLAEILFDESNFSEIVLNNQSGKRIRFGQVYATVMDDTIYCILSPIDKIEGVERDSALPFRMGRCGELKAVRDRRLAGRLFESYYASLGKQPGEKGENHE